LKRNERIADRLNKRTGCDGRQILDVTRWPASDFAIHRTAGIIGEAGATLSRMRSTGFAGASEARVLDRFDPLATLAAKEMKGKLRLPATAPAIANPNICIPA